MKKIKLLFVAVVLVAFSFSDQPIFSEDFSRVTSLSNWTLFNVRDIAGKEVIVKDFGTLSAGVEQISIDVSNLTNGIYFASMKIGEEVVTKNISVNK
tara:strand:- start:100017 stop:100307 length:291 start_codon:yes stop_codon:yes gene_type:complete